MAMRGQRGGEREGKRFVEIENGSGRVYRIERDNIEIEEGNESSSFSLSSFFLSSSMCFHSLVH